MSTTPNPPIARTLWLLAVLPAAVACGAFSGTGTNLEGGLGGPALGTEPGPANAGTQQGPATDGNDGAGNSEAAPAGQPNAVGSPNKAAEPNASPGGGPSPAKAAAFAFGAILDFDGLGPHGKQSAADFVKKTGVLPSVIDSYVQLQSDGTFELAVSQTLIDQAVGSKVPTVCLSVTSRVEGAISAKQLDQLVAAVTYGRDRGVNVEVRFGYEMNGDWSPSNSTNGVAYTPTKFLAQWAQVAPRVQAAGGKMFWSPNIPFNSGSALARWLPSDSNTIDLVGIDYYPKNNPLTAASVKTAIDTIYPIAKQLNKPMLFGESAWQNTGSSIQENASEAKSKVQWLAALTDASLRQSYPLYAGFRWFDYQKYENNTFNNFAISADPYAASAFAAWYKTSVFAGN